MYKFKKGNKIHIKKANRGLFTDYCGGQVTDECILRGKNSSNPAVRKRAVFADNARHFKHRLGGNVGMFQEGGKSGFSNFMNNGGGQAIFNGITSLILTGIQNKKLSQDASAQKTLNKLEWAENMKLLMLLNQQLKDLWFLKWIEEYNTGLTFDKPSKIVYQTLGLKDLNKNLKEGEEMLKRKNKLIDDDIKRLKQTNWLNTGSGILSSVGSTIMNNSFKQA